MLSLGHPAHGPLDYSRKQLIQLHGPVHGPGDDHLALVLQISLQRRASDALGRDATDGCGTYGSDFAAANGVLGEVRTHVAGTNRQHVNVVLIEFNPGGFADGIAV